jgi:hypothetical protein
MQSSGASRREKADVCLMQSAVIASEAKQSISPGKVSLDCFVAEARIRATRWLLAMTRPNQGYAHASPYTGSAIEYFTWLSAKLDSIEAMPSRRVSLFFKNAS